MEDGLKNLLKQIKLNENTISLLLGVAVVAIVGGMIVNYFRETPTKLPTIDQQAVSTALGDINLATDSAIATTSAVIADAKISPTVTTKPTATATPTKAPTVTPTVRPTNTVAPTATIVPTKTITATPSLTIMPTKVATVAPTVTSVPTATTAPTATPTKAAGQIAGGVTSQQPATTNYTVQKGDSLWKIAQTTYKSGYAWVEIAKANNLKNPGQLTSGQVLTMPTLGKSYPETIASVSIAPTGTQAVTTNKIEGASYTVVKGDNLWNIAMRAYGDGFKWVSIVEANKDVIKNPRMIEAGMNLKLMR